MGGDPLDTASFPLVAEWAKTMQKDIESKTKADSVTMVDMQNQLVAMHSMQGMDPPKTSGRNRRQLAEMLETALARVPFMVPQPQGVRAEVSTCCRVGCRVRLDHDTSCFESRFECCV